MSVWRFEESSFFASKFKKYQKKHRAETIAVLSNLDTYEKALNSGVKPPLIRAGFIHPEPQGVVGIDQKGTKGKARQTRLYIYACEQDHVVYLITIGDKNSQKQDIKDCKEFMDRFRKKE